MSKETYSVCAFVCRALPLPLPLPLVEERARGGGVGVRGYRRDRKRGDVCVCERERAREREREERAGGNKGEQKRETEGELVPTACHLCVKRDLACVKRDLQKRENWSRERQKILNKFFF